ITPDIGDKSLVADLDKRIVQDALENIKTKLEICLDQMKTEKGDVKLILVGGGSCLIPPDWKIKGASDVIRPEFYQVANAIGAALAQISGYDERVVQLGEEEALKRGEKRKSCIAESIESATEKAIVAGAKKETIEVVLVEEIPVPYSTGGTTKICTRVV